MNVSIFLLVILLASLRPSLTEPSGYLGCRFSPVCGEEEICAEDKLFGTCTSRNINSSPSYDLDSTGLKRLKDTIQFLLDRGFAWEDTFAQDSLYEVLNPYKLSTNLDPRPQEQPSVTTPEEEAWANVDELAEVYQATINEYQERYTAYLDLIEGYDLEDDPEVIEYSQELQQRYRDVLERLQTEERENLRQLYNLYYQKYLSLLALYSGAETWKLDGQEGLNNGQDYGKGDWKELHKLQQLKDYLQLVYSENKDRWVTLPEEPGAYTLDSFLQEWDGAAETDGNSVEGVAEPEVVVAEPEVVVAEPDVVEAEPEVAVAEPEVVLTEPEVVLTEPEVVVPEPEVVVAEPEVVEPLTNEELYGEELDLGNLILDNLNVNLWESLTDDEKNTIINEFLKMYNDDENGGGQKKYRGNVGSGEESQTISRGRPVGHPGKEYVEPIIQSKESGIKLDINLSKKDEDPAAMVTQELAANKQTDPVSIQATTKLTTFGASGYVFIALQSGISLKEAQMLVEELGNVLDAPEGSFTEIGTGKKQVTFLVHPDVLKMTTAQVAGAAATHQTDLEDMLGVTITETGVGKETHVTVLDDNSTLVILTVVIVACVVGILIAVITVYCYRQKGRIRAKLKGLSTNGGTIEGEATADYQDLCRQRMASKSSEKPESLSRISSVAMSDGAVPSPSSRSSTSSWSEEPVQSNMDISTGHIVLSYMEDHLRNKDRLTKEWEALCRYEPDVTTAKVGNLPANITKNRYKGVVPYDHTRVLLNDSTNAQSSDYINASTIADADPRNPAYIATQAPIPDTVADFWQMVWEQGVVVIVNLTPMTDTDTVRNLYWPTEGGTRYHYYEVHLVSEHVWCDDYLVRSFYLKNIEKQETRTVTQFHFLTWPENGIPPMPKALLEFRRKVNKSYRGKACPIVVHCSDGVGSTGTYCLVDMVLTRMTKGAKEIDIAATLEHIRDQRPGAVKRKEQFEFALTALAEEVNAILKALPQ